MNYQELNNLRADLIGELEAINQYREHIEEANSEGIKKTLEHIIADEKEHVAELTKLLRRIDSTQEEKFRKEEL